MPSIKLYEANLLTVFIVKAHNINGKEIGRAHV